MSRQVILAFGSSRTMPRFFDEFARASPDPTLIISAEGTIVALNGAALERLQTTQSTAKGMALETILDPRSESVRDFVRRVLLSRDPIAVSLQITGEDQPIEVIHAQAWRIDVGRGIHIGIRWTVDGEQEGNLTELILDTVREGVFGLDVEEKTTFVNRAAATMLGWSQEDLIGCSMHQTIHHTRPDGSPYPAGDCPINATLSHGEECLVETEVFWRKDGSRFSVEYSTSPIIENNELRGAVVVFCDVSVRRAQAQALRLAAEEREAIRQRAEQERELLLAVTKGIVEADTYDIALQTSMEHVCNLTGWDFAEAWVPDDSPRGWRVLPYWYGDREKFTSFRDLTELVAIDGPLPLLTRVAATGVPEWYPDVSDVTGQRYRRAEAATRAGLRATLAQPIVAEGKTLSVLIFMLEQARERDDALVELVGAVATQLGSTFRETEYRQRLEQSEERFRLIAENVMDAFWLTDGEFHDDLYVSPAAEKIWGMPMHEIVGSSGASYFDPVYEEDREAHRAALKDVVDRELSFEYRIVRPDGEIRWLRDKTRPIKDPAGTTRMIAGVTSDITVERAQQDRLRQVIERFNVAADAARIGIWDYDLESDEMFWDGRMYTIYGIDENQFRGDYDTWKRMVHPEDLDVTEKTFRESIRTDVVFDSEYRIVRPDGELRYIKSRSIVIRDERTDKPIRVIGSNMDISEQRELEAHIAHAQKMETVGQLSGGMAHDFNNLLSVIQGGLQLLARRPQLREDEQAIRWLNNSLDAVRRGAELSQRLLAFARRQRLEKRIVDVADLIDGMKELLRRTLGESIALEVVSRDAPLYVETDVSQLENAILNLAVNSRDAMPDGGQLTIDSRRMTLASKAEGRNHDIPPGEYVIVSVTDTGTGMTPEIQQRAFEPFYTTKDTGKGTGLGLSTVLGFCRQSGGHAALYSEVGIGTTVRLYFPARLESTDATTGNAVDGAGAWHGGTELILAVDDDKATRTTTVELLESFGYTVLAAENGAEAIQILRERPDIDLLFTDIVMPGGISGTDLARQARLMRPQIPVVFASGYSAEALRRDSGDLFDAEWITKPIDIDELARKIRGALSRVRLVENQPGSPSN